MVSDSRQAVSGSVFVALRGAHADGTPFARDALTRGSIAIVSEASRPADISAPWMQVGDARRALAVLAAAFERRPSEELTLVGITGTNGKTTTSYLLASIFEAAGVRCGRIGTLGHRIGKRDIETARTTPEAPDIQRMLREMVTEVVVPASWRCRPCAGASAHGRTPLCRRHLHQPDARSPRFPWRHGTVLPGEAPPVRNASRDRRRRDESR